MAVFEQRGVFAGGFGVVNGAGADEDEQARIAAVEDVGRSQCAR